MSYSSEFIQETTRTHLLAIQKAGQVLGDNSLKSVWQGTCATPNNPTTDTLMLLWYLADDGSAPHPQFTDVYTGECVACDTSHALDSQFHIGSECHELYKQRAIVLRWALYVFPWETPEKYLDAERREIFCFHVEMLKTFCSNPVYPAAQYYEPVNNLHVYSVTVPPYCKPRDTLELCIPLYSEAQVSVSVQVPDDISDHDTFRICFNSKTNTIVDACVPFEKKKHTTCNHKRKRVATDEVAQRGPRRSKRLHERRTRMDVEMESVVCGC